MTMTTIPTAELEDTKKSKADEKFENNKNSQNPISDISAFIAKLKWLNIIVITIAHAVCIKEMITYPYLKNLDLLVFTAVYGYIGSCGVTAGAHRLWTHRSYKAKMPLRIIWMLCHSSTGMSPIHDWVRDHRVHHKSVDTDADPYNARRGFFFSHVGWLLVKKNPKVIEMGKKVDMSDVLEDPVIQFHQKYYTPLVVVGFVLPSIIPPLLWGKSWYLSIITVCVIRWVFLLNIIWSINSVSHMFGNKPYDKYITATDNFWTSLVTFGESWHNFHHAFPWSYRFGQFSGYLSDIPGFCIDAFALIGWAYDLKTPSLELIKKASLRAGDASHPIWGAHMEIPESAEKEIIKNGISNDINKKK